MATASTILTTTAASTAVVGMREELGDIVSVMDPAETPFTSWLGTGSTQNTTTHEWLITTLRSARRSPTAEGNVASNSTPKTTTRHKNVCEIIQEQFGVSKSTQAADIAGGAGSMSFQEMHKAKELKKDLELAVIGPQGWVASDPREMGGIQAYAYTNTVGTGGTAPVVTGTSAGGTDVVYGTEQSLTVDLMNTKLQAAWQQGAIISLFFLSSAQKLAFDAQVPVDNLAEAHIDVTGATGVTVATTVAVWRSTFGQVKFIMDRILDEQGGWGQQCIIGVDERSMYRPKICTMPGRNWVSAQLGVRGDLDEKLLTYEGCLEVPNPRSIMLLGSLSDAYAS